MRQLRTCDFCGDDPTGVYEVLPASLGPTEAEQRRVALCAGCRNTLESTLEPLLARLDGSETASSEPAPNPATPAPERDPNPVAEPRSAPDPEPTPEPETPAEAAEPDENADDVADEGENADALPGERAAVRKEVRRIAPRGDRPPGYDKVLRLLQNREGAMKRDDLRTLVTNAYGLGDGEFDAVVDAAVENGDLAESRKGLRTT